MELLVSVSAGFLGRPFFFMCSPSLLSQLRAATPVVAPSLLACDFAHLADEIHRVEDAGARILHLDIMDGRLVPNISFGVPIVEAVRRSTRLPLDVHLMIVEPGRYVRAFREAGADLLTFHVEAVNDPQAILDEIHSLGCLAGLTLNPPTPVSAIDPYLASCDLVLVMSVMAGFGGQRFEPVALEKLRHFRKAGGPDKWLSVDGGVNEETIGDCSEAGANQFVAGTAVFQASDHAAVIRSLRDAAMVPLKRKRATA